MTHPRITLDQWNTLVSVVDSGGYARAADRIHKSQSTLTYAIKKLEFLLGVKVFELRGRKEEQSIPRTYLMRLQELYEQWFERYELSETLIIDTDQLDYLEDLVHRIDLFQKIEKALGVK